MPKDSYDELLTDEIAAASVENKEIEFDGKNMEAVVVLLRFLEHRLTNTVSMMDCQKCYYSITSIIQLSWGGGNSWFG